MCNPALGATGFVYDDAYLLHATGADHPESPQRLKAIVAHLQETGLLDRLTRLTPTPAPADSLTTIHGAKYVAEVARGCDEGRACLDAGDTTICKDSYRIALLAVGGAYAAVDAVMDGRVRNAFCAIRPPGHHALKDQAMGFCVFNNVALAARYAQQKHDVGKVLIVDWDVHHGNGTQAAFYDDPTVLYFSVHRSPFYPGSGAETETGSGAGVGYTVNIPLPAGSSDAQYLDAFERVLKPKALEFRPDLILISAGFDAHERDPLGGMKVTTECYGRLTRIVETIAEECCDGRLVSVLEGGYDLTALADSVETHLRVLLGDE
ncbi:MAG: histone deacetylase [Armatimonadetes bacterium]|nr:histone deacetylase [Armatimonadota bacterium]